MNKLEIINDKLVGTFNIEKESITVVLLTENVTRNYTKYDLKEILNKENERKNLFNRAN